MLIFVFAPESQQTIQLVQRLKMRGYNAEHASASHFTPAGDPAELDRQMRTRIMRLITSCDAVAVPDGAITAEDLSRLLVVCEFAGKPVVRYEDLPGERPEDGRLPIILAIGTRVCMTAHTPPVDFSHAASRVNKLVAYAAKFFDHGRFLKNPVAAGRASL